MNLDFGVKNETCSACRRRILEYPILAGQKPLVIGISGSKSDRSRVEILGFDHMLGFSSFIRLRASVLLAGLVASMLLVTAVFAATEDVIYMSDGRELHGEIVSETDTTIVFEYMNPDLGISVPLTLVKSMILKIDRDVEVDAPVEPEAAPAASGTSSSSSSSTSKASAPRRGNGARLPVCTSFR